MLSGFVITYAYQDKLRAAPAIGSFLIRRLIRLYPIIFLGVAVGFARLVMLAYLEGGSALGPSLVRDLAHGMLLIPSELRHVAVFFPVNFVMWSLHFELIAYIAFGLILYRLHSKWLWLLAAAALPGSLFWIAEIYADHYALGQFAGDHLGYIYGLSRLTISFTLGMLICRTMPVWSRMTLPGGRWLILLLVLPLALPASKVSFIAAVAMLLIVFPYILAAGSAVEEQPILSRIDTFLGNLSFPLYALHIPVMWTMDGAMQRLGLGFAENPVWNGILIIPAAIAISHLTFTLYDRPLRRALTLSLNTSGHAKHKMHVAVR